MYVQVDVHNVTCNICAYQCIEDTLFHLWTSRPYFSTSQSKSWMFPPVAASWAKWYPFYMLQWSCSSGDDDNTLTHWDNTHLHYSYLLGCSHTSQGEAGPGEGDLAQQPKWLDETALPRSQRHRCNCYTHYKVAFEWSTQMCMYSMYCFSHVNADILVIIEEYLWGYALAC